jgi:CysZ protein
MLDDMIFAANAIFTRPFRNVMLKTLLMTFGLLGLIFLGVESGIEKLLSTSVLFPYAWLTTVLTILGILGLVVGLAVLVAPISFVVGGFFFDELAEAVERDIDPLGPRGHALPAGEVIWISVRFALVSLFVNLTALFLWLVPGLGVLAFFGANAYLLGRGYFELAALRFLPFGEVRRLRALHAPRLFLAGLVMAGFGAVPIVNLLAPLFFPAFMVRTTYEILRRIPSPQHLSAFAETPSRRPGQSPR